MAGPGDVGRGTYAAGPGQFDVINPGSIPAFYALAAQRHMYEFGTTHEHLAEIAVTCRANAANNPHARYRDPLTIQEVVDAPMVASPFGRYDCCVVTDSGGAFVMTNEKRARDCRKPPVWVTGFGEAASQVQMSQMRPLTSSPARFSGPRAFEMAGVKHEDIDVAELYDAFTITPLLALEDLGFCEKGDGGPFVAAGNIRSDGSLRSTPTAAACLQPPWQARRVRRDRGGAPAARRGTRRPDRGRENGAVQRQRRLLLGGRNSDPHHIGLDDGKTAHPTDPRCAHRAVLGGAREGRLLIERNPVSGKAQWYPRPYCLDDWNVTPEWIEATGNATLYSFTVIPRSDIDEVPAPYVLAIVELEEGARMGATLIDVDPDEVKIGMALEVVFVPLRRRDLDPALPAGLRLTPAFRSQSETEFCSCATQSAWRGSANTRRTIGSKCSGGSDPSRGRSSSGRSARRTRGSPVPR